MIPIKVKLIFSSKINVNKEENIGILKLSSIIEFSSKNFNFKSSIITSIENKDNQVIIFTKNSKYIFEAINKNLKNQKLYTLDISNLDEELSKLFKDKDTEEILLNF